jgi:hypothetical protein
VPGLLGGRYDDFSDRFFRLRLRDGWDLWRRAPHTLGGAHVHFNAGAGSRGGLLIRDFVAHADRVCAAAGIAVWKGEMNAPAGTRARVLERYGAEIVHRTPNRTLSWLTGKEIERLTVARPVGDIVRVDAAPGTAPMVAGPRPSPLAPRREITRRLRRPRHR